MSSRDGSSKRVDTGRAPPTPFVLGPKVRQKDVARLPLSREEFEIWAKAGPISSRPGQHFNAKIARIYQKLCTRMSAEERMGLSFAVDRVRRGAATREEYDLLVDRVRARLWPGESPLRQQVVKVTFEPEPTEGRSVRLARALPLSERPENVWTLFAPADQPAPQLPIVPVHRQNAFREDYVHDWNWKRGSFRYYSRVTDSDAWVLLEYAAGRDE